MKAKENRVRTESEVGDPLELCSMANRAAFGIEYLLRGIGREHREAVVELLSDGVNLCALLQKASKVYGSRGEQRISTNDLFLYSVLDALTIEDAEPDQRHVREIVSRAKDCEKLLKRALSNEEGLDSMQLVSCQRFFNEITDPYLKQAAHLLEEHRQAQGVDYI